MQGGEGPNPKRIRYDSTQSDSNSDITEDAQLLNSTEHEDAEYENVEYYDQNEPVADDLNVLQDDSIDMALVNENEGEVYDISEDSSLEEHVEMLYSMYLRASGNTRSDNDEENASENENCSNPKTNKREVPDATEQENLASDVPDKS